MKRTSEILLVDDEGVDVKLIRKAFESVETPVHLTVASDGEEALCFLKESQRDPKKQNIDLVLLDINMPKINGREVLARLKRDPELRPKVVIMLSCSEDQRDVDSCYELGANGYVCKPSDLSATKKAIQSLCQFWLSAASLPS